MSTPRVGLHATRIPFFDVAFWDVVGTCIIGYGLARMLHVNAAASITVLLILSVPIHRLLSVDTRGTQLWSRVTD